MKETATRLETAIGIINREIQYKETASVDLICKVAKKYKFKPSFLGKVGDWDSKQITNK